MRRDRLHMKLVPESQSSQDLRACGDPHWAALVRRAQQGDVAAFERLASDHYTAVFSFSMALVGDRAEASDIAQEALIKAYRKLASYRFAASFRSWLLQIARNTFRDRLRQRQQQSLKRQRMADRAVAEAPADPEQQLMDKQVGQQLYAALGRLKPEFREVVVLFDLQGFAYREIAEICDVPMGTVKSRLRRGRDGLRQLLVQDGVIGPPGQRPRGGRRVR